MSGRLLAKRTLQACALTYAFPHALLCGFGTVKVMFELFAQWFSLFPGFVGSFVRAAFYRMTLEECSIDVTIGLGTYFSRSGAAIGHNVSIGSYCVIGEASIGARSQVSSHVAIPGGRMQHQRDAHGRLSDTVEGRANPVSGRLKIGEDCWIGEGAIVMANVGDQSTIGAGAVVVREIPAGVVAVGSPARPIKSTHDPE